MGPSRLCLLIPIGAVAADATDPVFYGCIPEDGTWEIKAAFMQPHIDAATHGSNYIVVALRKGTDVIASLSTNSSGGAAHVAGTAQSFGSMAGKGTTIEIAQGAAVGAALNVQVTQTASGTACRLDVALVLEKVR